MRLFSLLAVLLGLALSAKLGGLWVDWVARAESDRAVQVAQAQPEEPGAQPADATEPAAGEAGETTDAAATDAPAQGSPNPEPAAGDTLLTADPFSLTDQEIELLQSLADRRRRLEQRAEELDQREVVLQAAERRIDEKLAELNALKTTIEGLLDSHDEQEAAQLESLVRIYESMKPKDAARIFEELDMEVLLQVVERMKERKTAPILAEMNPDRAKAITVELAQRRDLPLARE